MSKIYLTLTLFISLLNWPASAQSGQSHVVNQANWSAQLQGNTLHLTDQHQTLTLDLNQPSHIINLPNLHLNGKGLVATQVPLNQGQIMHLAIFQHQHQKALRLQLPQRVSLLYHLTPITQTQYRIHKANPAEAKALEASYQNYQAHLNTSKDRIQRKLRKLRERFPQRGGN